MFDKLATNLITHVSNQERPTLDALKDRLAQIQQNIQNYPNFSADEKIKLGLEAQKLSEFEFGRFLIANKGALSGWWTYYCILGYKNYAVSHPLERFLIEEAPTVLATRERFYHFQKVICEVIKNNFSSDKPLKIASIPGGMAADLLTLNLDVDTKKGSLEFVNIDLDDSVFPLAQQLAVETKCKIPFTCCCQDAWSLTFNNEFDLIASNGLNIYVKERQKVVALYQSLLKALKPGGTLVTSALTPPPNHSEICEWNFNNIDRLVLARQAEIFIHILQATWSNFCTTAEMITRLQESGFVDINVIPDSRNMFPTFVARKPDSKH